MPELNCPFRAVEAEIEACGLKHGADAILVDFHAEATSEKQAMGYFVDGRASCVVGTHTHAPTADHRVLPRGTAFVSDIGMCGDYELVLGMDAGAAQPFPHQDPARAIRAGHGPGHALGAGGGDRRRDGAGPAHDRIAARWCFGTYRAAVLGRELRKRVRRFRKTANSVSQVAGADTRGSREGRPWAARRLVPECFRIPEADARGEMVNERLMSDAGWG